MAPPNRRFEAFARVALAASLLTVPAVAPATATGDEDAVVRAGDPRAADLLQAGVAASPTVLALLDRLRDSDVIVTVQVALPRFGAAGGLRILTTAGGCRYLLIRIRDQQSPWEQIAYLGHELQHAVEVAEAREVRDGASLALLMRRIGREGPRGAFETEAARRVTRQVQKEVRSQVPARAAGNPARVTRQ